MTVEEKKVTYKSIRLLEEATGFKISVLEMDQNKEPDAVVTIYNEDYSIDFITELKLFVNRARLGMIINQLRAMRGIPLLISRYINPELMDILEKEGINFIDSAGNALIKVPPLFIKLKGNKPAEEIGRSKPGSRLGEARLKVIFAILCNPGLEREPIRTIADFADSAVGTVHNTLDKIKNGGEITGRKQLLEEWVSSYPDVLREKYMIGRYAINQDAAYNLAPERYGALWGGEEAGARLTNYLKPYIYTIYLSGKEGEFILKNRLRKDARGKLILMKKFWNFESDEYAGITHPILTYADLLATGDTRNIDTANMIYRQYIVRYI